VPTATVFAAGKNTPAFRLPVLVIDGFAADPLAKEAALLIIVLPVDTLPSVIVPVPLALIVRFSLLPLEIVEIAAPPPAAADFMLTPVAEDAVEASTLNAGLVEPFAPAVRAVADVDVIVSPPVVIAPLIAAVPVAASALVPIVAPLSAKDVPDAAPMLPLKVTSPPVLFVLFPMAVTTPVPVVVVAGAAPAPPPIITALAASSAEDDICVVELK
jgi:hypothetical protein